MALREESEERSPPLGIRLLPTLENINRNLAYKIYIVIFTFLCYTSYHLSRKPISVVKSVLHHNCSILPNGTFDPSLINSTACDWKPFNGPNAQELLGSLDYAFLFSYAISMFISGHVAERMNLRYFLSGGMLLSGIFTAAFGFGKIFNIHNIIFYILVQVISGVFQATGWPSVVTCMGNWHGRGNRGLIMGFWNSHTSVGNILGSVIAGEFVDSNWGLSFIVPGLIIFILGILVFFFLVPNPEDVGCTPPDQEPDPSVNTNPPTESEDPSANIKPPTESEPLLASVQGSEENRNDENAQAISFCSALKIPGVIEFSLCLFFAKLISYTFLFWLPNYINHKTNYNPEKSAYLSTLFDFGGILGGIFAGFVSDRLNSRGAICMIMLACAAPMLYVYNMYGSESFVKNVLLLIVCGAFVNGPYALITTAVSADLGTHSSLNGNAKALATVTAIIDGTGSIGAAIGPFLTGVISEKYNWNSVFYMLITCDILAFLLLTRVTVKEIIAIRESRREEPKYFGLSVQAFINWNDERNPNAEN